jgi:hypothetical protein
VAVVLPCVPETDVGKADAAPGEECSQTRKRLKPIEGDGSSSVEGHERERRPCEDEDGSPQRSTCTVNVGEKAGRIALLSKRAQCTRATIDTRETNGDDGQHDDDVGEVGEADDASVVSDNDERRGFDVDETTAQESLICVGNEQTDESQRQNVEKGNAPENLLDRRRQRPCWVLRFGSSKTNKLSARKGESGGDKNTTEADKGSECARIRPRLAALVGAVSVAVVSWRSDSGRP